MVDEPDSFRWFVLGTLPTLFISVFLKDSKKILGMDKTKRGALPKVNQNINHR
jgi:hypothetical protein